MVVAATAPDRPPTRAGDVPEPAELELEDVDWKRGFCVRKWALAVLGTGRRTARAAQLAFDAIRL